MRGSKYQRTCSVCGASFDIKIKRSGRPSTRKTCSQKCSVANRPVSTEWSEADLEFLNRHIESLPIQRLVRAFNLWAASNNRPQRTKHAIEHKIKRLGFSTKPQIEYYSFPHLSQLLGISAYTVAGWKELAENPLQTYQHDGKKKAFNYVSLEDFKRFAQNHPECLGGANEIGLQLLLEDSKKAKEILRKYPKRNSALNSPKRVRCIETRKIYPSLSAAAKDVYVVRQGISKAIQKGHAANGFHFELLD